MDNLASPNGALASFLAFLPLLAFFLLILIIGFIIAKVLTKVIAKLLQKAGLNKLVERSGFQVDAATIPSKVVFYTLMLFVLTTAFGVFGPTNPVSQFLAAIVAYLPLVFVAILIILIAAAVAAAAKGLIQNSLGNLSYGKILANAVSGVILAVGVIAALNQLGIAENIVNGIFYAFLVAVVGIAIVAIGGGGIVPMKSRWERALATYDAEKPKIQKEIANAPSLKEQGRQAKGTAEDKAARNRQQPGTVQRPTTSSRPTARRPRSTAGPGPTAPDRHPAIRRTARSAERGVAEPAVATPAASLITGASTCRYPRTRSSR